MKKNICKTAYDLISINDLVRYSNKWFGIVLFKSDHNKQIGENIYLPPYCAIIDVTHDKNGRPLRKSIKKLAWLPNLKPVSKEYLEFVQDFSNGKINN